LRHHITNIEADDASSDEFQVRANYSVIEVLNDDLPRILSAGRYLDRVVLENGLLRFKEKRVIYDSVLVPNSLIYPL
ncbi:MAG: salicylate hydroxylase, partial [Gammaproteobacteria bacterium]|nr:salicylate hydroxylase [Gammaproteobacteria bacterium]